MTNNLALILNLILGALCAICIVVPYFSKDNSRIWSPITFFALTYLYYCVIPMFETDGIFMGISSAPYANLFHSAALLSFISILLGFYFIRNNSNSSSSLQIWESGFNTGNYRGIAIVLFLIVLLCYVPIRSFQINMFITDEEIVEYDWDNQGINYYFISMVSLLVTVCCILISRIKENRLLFSIFFWITFVMYVILGFRYRIIILIIAVFTTYHLHNTNKKIRLVPVIFVVLALFVLFNIMDTTRSYGNGIRIDLIREMKSEDFFEKASETDHVYNFSTIVIGRYHESGRLDTFAPIINAFFFPLPRAVFPWKPKAEYAFQGSEFAMRGEKGSAYLGFVEAFMAFSWIGIIINGLFWGWVARRFWNLYRRNPKSEAAIIALAIFNGLTYVIVSRGYLSMQYFIFLYFIVIPFIFVRFINYFFSLSRKALHQY